MNRFAAITQHRTPYHVSHAKSGTGFIALTSVLILSAILLVLMFTASTSAYFARFDALGGENKRESLALAESCINVALLALATSTSPSTEYPSGVTTLNRVITVGADEGGNPTTCTIQSITRSGTSYMIDVQASYHGAFSNVTAGATVPDPSVSVLIPTPTCALTASPTSVPSGQSVLLQWGVANATTFSLDHGIGTQSSVASGSHSVVATGSGPVTYVGTATGPGGSVQCSATFTVTPPPPSPACADTMMIFDRSGSITAQDRINEQTAASQLIDLYASVTSFQPKIGAGFFGARDGSGAEVPFAPNDGHLSTAYTALKNTITNVLADPNGRTGSDLGAGIKVGFNELGSGNHTPGFKKVLIFVSDGEPNRASPDGTCPMSDPKESLLCRADVAKIPGNDVDIFTVQYTHQTNPATAAAARALLAQVATGTIPYAGHTKGSEDNSNAPSETGLLAPATSAPPHFSNFSFSLPGGSIVTGLQVEVSGIAINTTGTLFPNGQGSHGDWVNGEATVDETASFSCSSSDSVTTSGVAFGGRESVRVDLTSVPAGATITSVDVVVYDKADTLSGGTYTTFASIDGTTMDAPGVLSALTTMSSCNPPKTQTIDVPDTVKDAATVLEVGVVKVPGNNNTLRVGALQAVVRYTTGTPISCPADVDLSWNNGASGSWTTGAGVGIKTVTVNSTPTEVLVGGMNDKWGRSAWSSTDISNGKFVVRVTPKSCGAGKTALITDVRANVHYTGFNPAVENADGDAFFITPDTSSPAAIKTIFDTIGRKVCPAAAAQCGNGIDDDGDGLNDSADPMCHVGGNLANAYDPNINDEYEHPAPPAPPIPPAAPPPINLGSWTEIPH